jgi:hypothetical protein
VFALGARIGVRSTWPVGASYSVTSCDLRILVDQPTESISPRHPPRRHDDRWLARPERRQLPVGCKYWNLAYELRVRSDTRVATVAMLGLLP